MRPTSKEKKTGPTILREENSDIVSQLVRKEADQGGSDEDTERQDCIPEVRLDGSDFQGQHSIKIRGRANIRMYRYPTWEQCQHRWYLYPSCGWWDRAWWRRRPRWRRRGCTSGGAGSCSAWGSNFEGSTQEGIRRLKRKMKTNHKKFCKILKRCFHRCANEIMKPLFSPAGGFAMLWKMNKRGNNKEGIRYIDWSVSKEIHQSKRRARTQSNREMEQKSRESKKEKRMTGKRWRRVLLEESFCVWSCSIPERAAAHRGASGRAGQGSLPHYPLQKLFFSFPFDPQVVIINRLYH